MKIVLNLLPLKTGGGVQVALDFLVQAKIFAADIEWKIVCREKMPFLSAAGGNVLISRIVADNLMARLHFEYVGCRAYIESEKPDAIFTLFGPHWPGVSALNIVGCAYSNLFYPELEFWAALPWYRRWLKEFVDRKRMQRLATADVRIFETEDLATRALNQCGFERHSVHVVSPACSSLVTLDGEHFATRKRCASLPAGYRVLLVSGYHPNKNIDLLVLAAYQLKKMGIDNVRFILTLPPAHEGTRKLLALADSLGVSAQIFNLGPVPQEGCCELYRACDAAVLPSTLESFSNMIAEAWAMRKPLLISDLGWARSLCGDGAIYFGYRNAADLASRIVALMNGHSDIAALIDAGERQLATYPKAAGRFQRYLDVIEKSVAERRKPCVLV